jgi:hypothetical protein
MARDKTQVEMMATRHVERVREALGADKNLLRVVELSFVSGALAVCEHLKGFIEEKTAGQRTDTFSRGVDEGLLWTAQELQDFMEGL